MKSAIRSSLNICCIILISLIVFSGCGRIKKDPKYTAAIVNGKAITRVTFDNEINRIKQRFQEKTPANINQIDDIQMEVLEILIGGELLYQASQENSINVSKKDIDAELARISKQFPETETFKTTFTKEDIQRKLAIEKFIKTQFADTTIISDEESKTYYQNNLDDFTKPEQVMASHILLTLKLDDEAQRETAKQTLTKIKERILAGEDFATLAKQNSHDSTAKNGGALGYFMRGQMTENFEKAAFALEKGEVSDIVETEFGFHLIKVLDKKPTVVISYEEIADKLKAYLKQQQIQKKVDNFIKEQRKAANVEVIIQKNA